MHRWNICIQNLFRCKQTFIILTHTHDFHWYGVGSNGFECIVWVYNVCVIVYISCHDDVPAKTIKVSSVDPLFLHIIFNKALNGITSMTCKLPMLIKMNIHTTKTTSPSHRLLLNHHQPHLLFICRWAKYFRQRMQLLPQSNIGIFRVRNAFSRML